MAHGECSLLTPTPHIEELYIHTTVYLKQILVVVFSGTFNPLHHVFCCTTIIIIIDTTTTWLYILEWPIRWAPYLPPTTDFHSALFTLAFIFGSNFGRSE